MEVSPYLEPAANRLLSRMVEAGMLEEIMTLVVRFLILNIQLLGIYWIMRVAKHSLGIVCLLYFIIN